MTAVIKGNKLVVEIDMVPAGTKSKSGKSETVASSFGNQAVAVGNQVITIGLNAYKKVA